MFIKTTIANQLDGNTILTLEKAVVSAGTMSFYRYYFTLIKFFLKSERYNQLVAAGMENYCEALQVGIDIEKLDIIDIEAVLEDVTTQDLVTVLNHLLIGPIAGAFLYSGPFTPTAPV